mmetsp:Transcript_101244/g.284391  ORF Transcript_101244/g.284391 Transcript_101244/m.284391 type:complete len:200 (+) Transcript_101244:926-1525(+)
MRSGLGPRASSDRSVATKTAPQRSMASTRRPRSEPARSRSGIGTPGNSGRGTSGPSASDGHPSSSTSVPPSSVSVGTSVVEDSGPSATAFEVQAQAQSQPQDKGSILLVGRARVRTSSILPHLRAPRSNHLSVACTQWEHASCSALSASSSQPRLPSHCRAERFGEDLQRTWVCSGQHATGCPGDGILLRLRVLRRRSS